MTSTAPTPSTVTKKRKPKSGLSPGPDRRAEAAAALERLRTDPAFFAQTLWADRRLDRVAVLGEIEFDMIEWGMNGPRFRGALAPRGFGKTHVVTAALAVWRLFRNPDRKILIVSKSHGEAKKTLKLIRNWISACWFLRHLDPLKNVHVDSATQFDVGTLPASEEGRQCSVTALGIDGQLEGNRAHTIIADDCETEKNTETLDAREKLDKRVGEFKDILYPALTPKLVKAARARGEIIDPNEIVYVGTFHNEDSLYEKLSQRGYEFRTWPLVAPSPGETYLGLAPLVQKKLDTGELQPDDPVIPYRLGADHIADKMAEGWHRFAMQHKLVLGLATSNKYPLRLADLMVMDVGRDEGPLQLIYGRQDSSGSTALEDLTLEGLNGDRLYRPAHVGKDWAPFLGTKAGLDPSGVGDDRTGLAIVSALAARLFLKAIHGLPGGADEDSLNRIARLLRQHDAREVYVEINNDVYGTYRQMLASAIARHTIPRDARHSDFPNGWTCAIVPHRAQGQKELRIIGTLEPVISSHRLVVDRVAVTPLADEDQTYQHLYYQLTRLTKQPKCLKEDGMVDALEIVVAKWEHALAGQPEDAAKRTKKGLFERLISEARRKPRANWIKPLAG